MIDMENKPKIVEIPVPRDQAASVQILREILIEVRAMREELRKIKR